MSDKEIEQQIQAKGLTAPRVTLLAVQESIVGEVYIVPTDENINQENAFASGKFDAEQVKRTTLCILTLRNGFTVTGINHGPVSAANFDRELGRQLARQKAVEQIWPLLGYQLKQQQWIDAHFPQIAE